MGYFFLLIFSLRCVSDHFQSVGFTLIPATVHRHFSVKWPLTARLVSQSWKLAVKDMDIKSDMKTWRVGHSVSYWLRCGVQSSKKTCSASSCTLRPLSLAIYECGSSHWPSLRPTSRYLQQHPCSCPEPRSLQEPRHQSHLKSRTSWRRPQCQSKGSEHPWATWGDTTEEPDGNRPELCDLCVLCNQQI